MLWGSIAQYVCNVLHLLFKFPIVFWLRKILLRTVSNVHSNTVNVLCMYSIWLVILRNNSYLLEKLDQNSSVQTACSCICVKWIKERTFSGGTGKFIFVLQVYQPILDTFQKRLSMWYKRYRVFCCPIRENTGQSAD